jgi:hypothetical protein
MVLPLVIIVQYGSIVGFFNHLARDDSSDLRMQFPPLATNFDGLHVSLTENHRKTAIPTSRQDGTDARDLEC